MNRNQSVLLGLVGVVLGIVLLAAVSTILGVIVVVLSLGVLLNGARGETRQRRARS